ncbi:hypothetical protein PISL3812_01019 [Talaromyces islandicus]|uniref:Uncharacterized protein n=1 Tax=Talaromyces islandicus TaxID=28573 RepID=A0A0U1LKU9_TALIS|nr:hypothetical protein PISL3812_01019 [Talaromyces islandicus]
MAALQYSAHFNGQRVARRNFNPNHRRRSSRPNKQRLPVRDADGNIAMGGMDLATPSSFPLGRSPYRGSNRRGGPRQPRSWNQNKIQKGPRNGTKNTSSRPGPSFWDKVNWEPKDAPMEDAPAPPEWSQFSHADTNGLHTQIDVEGDVVMGEAPPLAMTLLTELMDVISLRS